MNDLKDYAIHASDGNIGHVKDFTFDDKAWVIRYLVVDADTWSGNRKVLISPIGVRAPNWGEKTIPVAITKEQVKNSPVYDEHKPLTKQHEVEYLGYYNYPYYWGGPSLWGDDLYPGRFGVGSGSFNAPPFVLRPSEREPAEMEAEPHAPHELRSGRGLIGARIVGSDGDIGLVRDLLIEEGSWAIRYLAVDTGDWWHAQQILIAPQWIGEVNWPDTIISINMSRQDAKDAPYYDPSVKIDRELEAELHEHYGQPFYWVVEAERAEELHTV
jgi:sporulation protein YlmC with PRC-barrel domain